MADGYPDLSPTVHVLDHAALRVLVSPLPLLRLHLLGQLHARRGRERHHRHRPAVVRRRAPQLCRECSVQPLRRRRPGPPLDAAQGGRQDRHHRDPRGRRRGPARVVEGAAGGRGEAGGGPVPREGGAEGRQGRRRGRQQPGDLLGMAGRQLAGRHLLEQLDGHGRPGDPAEECAGESKGGYPAGHRQTARPRRAFRTNVFIAS